jgi:hypothetical protein
MTHFTIYMNWGRGGGAQHDDFVQHVRRFQGLKKEKRVRSAN